MQPHDEIQPKTMRTTRTQARLNYLAIHTGQDATDKEEKLKSQQEKTSQTVQSKKSQPIRKHPDEPKTNKEKKPQ